MTKDEVKNFLKTAFEDNTLLSPKHDPNNLGTTFDKFRTVVSFEVAENLPKFIDVGIDKVIHYSNTRYPNSPTFIEIVPKSEYSIASSGVTAYSPLATSALDRIVAVSGTTQGWHIYGENSARILNMLSNGDLTGKTELH